MKTPMRRNLALAATKFLLASTLFFTSSGLENNVRAITDKSPHSYPSAIRRSIPVQSNQKRFEVELERLECDHTTENGADEVYILVTGKNSDGKQTFSKRLPSNHPREASGHWDMNDSGNAANNPKGDSRHITNKSLFVSNIGDGDAWDLVFVFMEEDHGAKGENVLSGFGEAMAATENPYAIAAGALVTILTESGVLELNVDSDDVIGVVSLHVTNEAGKITTSWNAVDRVNQRFPFKNAFQYEFNGDGSFYKAWINTKYE